MNISAAIADPLFRCHAEDIQPLRRVVIERGGMSTLGWADSPFGPSTYCTGTPRVLWSPRAGLTTWLVDFATN